MPLAITVLLVGLFACFVGLFGVPGAGECIQKSWDYVVCGAWTPPAWVFLGGLTAVALTSAYWLAVVWRRRARLRGR